MCLCVCVRVCLSVCEGGWAMNTGGLSSRSLVPMSYVNHTHLLSIVAYNLQMW